MARLLAVALLVAEDSRSRSEQIAKPGQALSDEEKWEASGGSGCSTRDMSDGLMELYVKVEVEVVN